MNPGKSDARIDELNPTDGNTHGQKSYREW